MARLLSRALVALAPLAGEAVTLSSLGSGTACRSTAVVASQCVESSTQSCRDRYDLMIRTTLQDCKTVCETLAASCTGIEWLTPGSGSHGRCEIWKVPILATVSATNFECFEDTENATDATDMPLYLTYDLEFPTLNWTALSGMASTVDSEIVPAIKAGIVQAYGTTSGISAVTGVATSNVDVAVDYANEVAKVYMTPPAGASPLIMYAVLRPAGSDNHDGNVPITAGFVTTLQGKFAPIVSSVPAILKSGQSSATVQIKSLSRRLLASLPWTSTRTTTPAPPAAPTPAPTPAPVGGAGGSRFAITAFLFTAATALVAAA